MIPTRPPVAAPASGDRMSRKPVVPGGRVAADCFTMRPRMS
ncbi:MAG TPA: hypothetical protein VFB63_10705 [Bryobacteraceae bacterium]|nr:hypothetical protein [Bryobacteraceae bacterium]